MLDKIILFFLENRLITILLFLVVIIWGIISAPFEWEKGFLPSDPVPVDAIPNLGENQQIVFAEWPGRSPQDIDDQITYPLTTALLGIPGVKTIRSNSIFGLSSIYVIFDEDIEFYWSRSRILEKLNALPPGALPDDIVPALGPDATALGQVFWYTLEGRDKDGKPSGGWDPFELRSIQDYFVKYALTATEGVAEVSSIGGFVKEYQIELDPAAIKAHNITIPQIIQAVKASNLDIGARTIEFNRAEYLIRSLGYIKSLSDLENTVITSRNHVPIRLQDIGKVQFGPAARRGGLDKEGVEAVGGVVVARYGANPMQVIKLVKEKIDEISAGLPSKKIEDGSESKVTIIPFYDRSGLIRETLGTLEEALTLEMIISMIVVIILVMSLRASLLISSILPIGVLMTFIVMRRAGVDANIVALSGIAIAIGVMVDVAIVIIENIMRHKDLPEHQNISGKSLLNIIHKATSEVAPAVITALTTTTISFLPVFAMQAAEGKLFRPLAFTKTFAMISALIIGLIFIPAAAYYVFSSGKKRVIKSEYINFALIGGGILALVPGWILLFFVLSAIGLIKQFGSRYLKISKQGINQLNMVIILAAITYLLTEQWTPLGVQNYFTINFIFVLIIIALILVSFWLVVRFYPGILNWCLSNKLKFLLLPSSALFLGIIIWSGLGREFMPALDEGSFLLMPTTMPHSGVEENLEVIRLLDKRVNSIPEVESVVGKWGRVNSALDPAPVSMFENVINYKSEYILGGSGRKLRFRTNSDSHFILTDDRIFNPQTDNLTSISRGDLIEDEDGQYFRQWRDHIKSPDDIWKEIVKMTSIPGLTSAPKLQPIQTRLVMLQTGMRAPMGIKVFGPDLQTIEQVGLELERHLKQVQGINPASVFADRVVGKPYLEINPDRQALNRYNMTIADFQTQLSAIIGGMELTTTVEGRERYPVRIRYGRELRDDPERLKNVLLSTSSGALIPLEQLAGIRYARGPQMIRSENTFLSAYIIFDKTDGLAEVEVIENARDYLNLQITLGNLQIPAGVSYVFTGNYENQTRAAKRLLIVIPISLLTILLILYLQFRSLSQSLMIFSGVAVAFSGGFILLWLYGQGWFFNFPLAGMPLRDIFQMHSVNLSVAVWVGFIALFGIATDDGVLISSYLKQVFAQKKPQSINEIRAMVLEAGKKRIRPAMMTTATTIIALLPVLTSTGKGSDIMAPMAIPIAGGMLMAILTVFIVPVMYSAMQENNLSRKLSFPLKKAGLAGIDKETGQGKKELS